jgi:hypothetical protein
VNDSDGQLVGIVSEGDLLHRAETRTERRIGHRRSRWLDATTGTPLIPRSERSLANACTDASGSIVIT